MGTFSNGYDAPERDELRSVIAPSPRLLAQPTSPPAMQHRDRVSQKSALILRLLRQKARASRNNKPKAFYSIREVASEFGVPATTVSRIYAQLKAEGLLTTVWGSKTFIPPLRIDTERRIRGAIALPASLMLFSMVPQYRSFFLEMRDALWKIGFATSLFFYEQSDAQLAGFADGLLNCKPDVVIWFLPAPKLKQTAARLLDRGIRVMTVADSSFDCREHLYAVDRAGAIKDILLHWRKIGVRSVTVFKNADRGSSSRLAVIEKCLHDTETPHAFASPESLQTQDILLTPVHRITRGLVFASVELAASVAAADPRRFTSLSERSRILLFDGTIDVLASHTAGICADVVAIDFRLIAKQIVKDLTQSAREIRVGPLTFQAKWIPTTGALASNLIMH